MLIRVYRKELVVGPEHLDAVGHVNNVWHIHWMQDIAIEHSTAIGWGTQRYLDAGAAWFVRRHTVNYLHPILLGDVVAMETWVADLKRVSCLREYRFVRKADGVELATAETKWGMVDLQTGLPTRVPQELADLIQRCNAEGEG